MRSLIIKIKCKSTKFISFTIEQYIAALNLDNKVKIETLEIIYDLKSLHQFRDKTRESRRSLGFVPTMGALHEGHISLINAAKSNGDVVLCSIFVNPTQFNDYQDFLKYPSTIDHDLEMLLNAGCDAVFVPTVEEMYPDGADVSFKIDLGILDNVLEAAHRPGHFNGVVQIVKNLLEAVMPDHLFLGSKDFQQVLVIRKLVETMNWPIIIIPCPTVREKDGLAMSSRNVRLSAADRINATEISKALFEISANYQKTAPDLLTKSYIERLNLLPNVDVEYLELVDSHTLLPLNTWVEQGRNLLVAAVKVGGVRLIDNLVF